MTEICNETFVNFIKTSTGFGTRGASIEDINIINEIKNEVLEIKASGGIKTIDDALKFIELGVTRIGTSNGVEIMNSDTHSCGCGHVCECHHEEHERDHDRDRDPDLPDRSRRDVRIHRNVRTAIQIHLSPFRRPDDRAWTCHVLDHETDR